MTEKFPIDIVVTYVDDHDPVWKKRLSAFNVEYTPSRWRSWDTLRYWFRGAEKNIPFARNVYMVVSNPEQVPSWLDRDKARIVLHEEIIPGNLLPTFNSTTIEMFLHRIPGLAEHFIYSNDDMIAVNETGATEFFTESGKPIYDKKYYPCGSSIFRRHCLNSFNLAKKVSGATDREFFYIAHSMTPMLKSAYEAVWEKCSTEITRSCTKFREPWNFTQYLFPDWALMNGMAAEGESNHRYFRLGDGTAVLDRLKACEKAIACVNDSVDDGEYSALQPGLLSVLDGFLPGRSRFEKDA